MSYLVLARKYRPQGFDELVGQDHVVRTLTNALEAKRVGHAYIFSGPRGCGKTTSARILAKALNCQKGPTPAPCNACPTCKEIAEGASTDDVLEIDGASNRGIDQIRELRDTVKYAPARSRYRIVIIDEAHQITDAGFNALLKTLEEPPPHAVFMMATTESQKIPATILSRCQRFQLKSIPPADTVKQLKKILAAENVRADDEALFDVARAAHGGLRDALSLLDQVIAYAPQGVTAQGVRDLLGLLPREAVRGFAAVLREGSPEKALAAVQRAVDDGLELGQLAQNLLDHFHELLLWKNGVRAEGADPAAMDRETALYASDDLERAVSLLADAVDRLRRSEAPRVAFELACLDLARRALPVDEVLDRLEALEARLAGGAPPPLVKKKPELTPAATSVAERPATPARPVEPVPSIAAASPRPAAPTAPPLAAIPAPLPAAPIPPASPAFRPAGDGAATPRLTADALRAGWPRVVAAVGARKPALEPFLSAARPEASPDGSLRLLCKDEFQRSQIAAHLTAVAEATLKEIGPAPVSCALAPAESAAPRPAPPVNAPRPERDDRPDDAEEASDEEAGAPPPDEDDAPEAPSSAAAASPAAQAARAATPADDLAASSSSAVDAAEVAALDPGLKKVLDRFPGKLKRIEEATPA